MVRNRVAKQAVRKNENNQKTIFTFKLSGKMPLPLEDKLKIGTQTAFNKRASKNSYQYPRKPLYNTTT